MQNPAFQGNSSGLAGQDTSPGKTIDLFKLNRQIAYRGRIGRRREQYCVEQIRYMGVCHRKIGQDQLEYVKSRGEKISCGEGCSHCCRAVYVGATLQECEAIAYYLNNHEALLSAFREKYPAWREGVSRGGDVFAECEKLFNGMLVSGENRKTDREFQGALERHNRQGIVCPFLIDDRCSIYEVRPSNCAGFFVTHPPELCRRSAEHKPRFNLTSVDDVLFDVSYYHRALAHPVTIYMPVAVYRILEEGYYYVAQFPGLEGMETEAMADPEVREMVRALYFSS